MMTVTLFHLRSNEKYITELLLIYFLGRKKLNAARGRWVGGTTLARKK